MKQREQEREHLLKEYVKEQSGWVLAAVGAVFLSGIFFLLCHLPMVVFAYMSCLYLACQGILFLLRYVKYRKHHFVLLRLTADEEVLEQQLPEYATLPEKDYRRVLVKLVERARQRELVWTREKKETADYDTLWGHQIKVPIAAMRLILQTGECEDREELLEKLFVVEGYVEMLLYHQRLGSLHEDLSIRRCALEDITREAVHKYARMFIRKKIGLEFLDFHCEVLTDPKWLRFIIEQILSNALKYTKSGNVHIYCDVGQKCLMIRDTGVGIAEEDIPRIFERGFTGENGRMEYTSTGLGLYLCNRIAKELSHKIVVASARGEGTTVTIQMDQVTIL